MTLTLTAPSCRRAEPRSCDVLLMCYSCRKVALSKRDLVSDPAEARVTAGRGGPVAIEQDVQAGRRQDAPLPERRGAHGIPSRRRPRLRLRESRLPRGPWGLVFTTRPPRRQRAVSPARRCLEDDACQSPRRGAASDDRRRGRWRPLRGPRRRASARAGGAPEAGPTNAGDSQEDRKRRAVTFGKLCADYVAWRTTTSGGRTHRPASPRSIAVWHSMLKLHILPAIGSKPIGEMRMEDFARVLEGAVKRAGPSMGPRCREMLSAVWRWVEGRKRLLGVELPPESPLAGLPRDIGPAPTSERDRVLSPAEVWSFWRATESEGLAPGLALRLMLLTAARVQGGHRACPRPK